MSREDLAELAFEKFGKDNWNRTQSNNHTLRFGRHGSVAVEVLGPRAGKWYDHEGKCGGIVGRSDVSEHREHAKPKHLLTWDSRSADKFRCVLERELSGVHGAAATYLERRGITRYPHSVMSWGDNLGIAYIAQSDDGARLALQVLPLTRNGYKDEFYWPDGVTKRTYAAARGWHHFAAVRMPGRGEPILCEGPETGMSIWLATGRPVLAAMGSSGLKTLKTRAKRLTLALDGDEEGSPAWTFGEEAAAHRRYLGQTVTVVRAPAMAGIKGSDFNDVHAKGAGLSAVTEMFRK